MVPVTGYVYSLLLYNDDNKEPIVSVFEKEEDAIKARDSRYFKEYYKHRIVETQKIHNGFIVEI
jgi:hypothetical protein